MAKTAGSDDRLTPGEIELGLRQLALVDRVLGLEAEVARLSAASEMDNGARHEIERLQGELRAVYGSRTWAVGSAMMRFGRPRRSPRAT